MKHEVIASELHLQYGFELQGILDDYMESLPAQEYEIALSQPTVEPVQHGYDFGRMYEPEDGFSLHGYGIDWVYSDLYGSFAGFVLTEAKTGENIEKTGLNFENVAFHATDNLKAIRDSHAHTRIVGFRTTKNCHSAKQIMSVQPIYYSVNE